MTRKSVSQGKGHALPRSSAGGLTCSEGQVDDVLSAGESTATEEERALPHRNSPIKA